MENYTKIKIKNHILKIVGVFPINSEFEQKAIFSGYEIHQFAPTSLPFYKDYFYKGFRNLYTLNGENNKVRRLTKKTEQGLTLLAENKEIKISINQVDLFLFPDSFGMFTLDLKVEFNEQSSQLAQFSDACFVVREFERGLIQGTDLNWNAFIVKEYLLDQINRAKEVELDEYSGTKFKLYITCEFEEDLDLETQNALLYDIGCIAQPGTAISKDANAPSEEYKKQLAENYQFSAFRNWRGIALLDSFVIVGNNILTSEFQFITFKENYFLIYLHNLYVKYNLFKMNTGISDFKTDLRPDLRDFLNVYNLSFISYNFLPAMINTKLRVALDVENEVVALTKRIQEIGEVVEERSQEKTNILLGLVSFLASFSAIEPFLGYAVTVQEFFNLPSYVAYIILIGGGSAIISFIFFMPEKIKNYFSQWI
ncbi:hypothetical protein U0R10_02165 [Aquirufa sp. OSTEICH-129V]|uniref:Uncharacterized protein n=1 Tax=Aquirufa avitistagni TaxID=3104728 RepID=A0ABW6D9G8_9BACT